MESVSVVSGPALQNAAVEALRRRFKPYLLEATSCRGQTFVDFRFRWHTSWLTGEDHAERLISCEAPRITRFDLKHPTREAKNQEIDQDEDQQMDRVLVFLYDDGVRSEQCSDTSAGCEHGSARDRR